MSKAVTPSAPSILPSPSPPLSSRGQRAAAAVFTKRLAFINYEPITKKGILEHNPQIEWIYTTSGKPEPEYEAVEEKKDGAHLGTIYKIVRAKPKKTASKWLGKIGQGLEGLKDDPNTRRTRTKKELNFDALREKIGYDLYQELGRGIFRVPKTRLSLLPILNKFLTLGNLTVQATIQSIEGRTLESLRIMSRYIEGYHDFKAAFVAVDGFDEPFDFITFLHNYRRPPDAILTPDRKKSVPLRGMMGLLAVGRMLGDTDIIGGRGDNAGFVWVKDPEGKIIAAQVYKIDPGECFKFDLNDTASNGDLSPSANWVVNTLAKKIGILEPRYFLNDEKDLQTAQNNGQITIYWSSLSEDQKDEFLATLFNCSRYLQAEDILKYLFYRDGRFNRSEVEQIPENVAKQYQNELRTWFEMQLNIYGKELQDFKTRHPEQVLKAEYLDRYGELALPTSEETLPIRELFTNLVLIEKHDGERSEKPQARSETESTEEKKPGVNKKITLEELLSPLEVSAEKSAPRKVLILGSAGSGKSTLCQKAAHDWASGRWDGKYKAVYWLRLRDYNTAIQPGGWLAGEKNLERWLSLAIGHQVLGQDFLIESLHRQFCSHKQEILVFLDGLDEASPELLRIIDQMLADPELNIVITSRHEAAGVFSSRVDRIVDNTGFSDEQIGDYSQRYFQRRNQQDRYLVFLQSIQVNPSFFQVAHIPLHLQMLCTLWATGIREFPSTLTALYEEMGHLLFSWHYRKANKDPKDQQTVLSCLGQLALWGLENHQLVPLSVAKSSMLPIEDLLASGILRESNDREYEFIHLTFQEYLSALFISTQSPDVQKQFVIEKRYFPRFRMVIRFLAGITAKKAGTKDLESSKEFFRWLYFSSESVLTRFFQFELVVACLNECSQEALHQCIYTTYGHERFFSFMTTGFQQEGKPRSGSKETEIREWICSLFRSYPIGMRETWKMIHQFLVKHGNSDKCRSLIRALCEIGTYAPLPYSYHLAEVLKKLLDLNSIEKFLDLDLYGVSTRKSALKALSKIAQTSPRNIRQSIVMFTLNLLENCDKKILLESYSEALGEMVQAGPTMPILRIIKALWKSLRKDTNRTQIAVALYRVTQEAKGISKDEVDQIIQIFIDMALRKVWGKKGWDGDRRLFATKALGAIARIATENQIRTHIFPALSVLAKDKRSGICDAAIKTLGCLPPINPRMLPVVIAIFMELLNDHHKVFNIIDVCKKMLGNSLLMTQQASSFTPMLIWVLETEKHTFEFRKCFGQIARSSPEQALILRTWLLDGLRKSKAFPSYFIPVFENVAQTAPEQASVIVAELINILKNVEVDRVHRIHAGCALMNIKKFLSTGQLSSIMMVSIQMLLSPDINFGLWIVDDFVDKIPTIIVPQLLKVLLQCLKMLQEIKPSASGPVSMAFRILGKLGEKIDEASLKELLETLFEAQNDPDLVIRRAVIESLGNLARAVPQQGPAILEKLSQVPERSVVTAMTKALIQAKASDPRVGNNITFLLGVMDDSLDEDIHCSIIETLSEAAKSVPVHLKAIVQVLFVAFEGNKKRKVRDAALEALHQVINEEAMVQIPSIPDVILKSVKKFDDSETRMLLRMIYIRATRQQRSYILENLLRELHDTTDSHLRLVLIKGLKEIVTGQQSIDTIPLSCILPLVPLPNNALSIELLNSDIQEVVSLVLGRLSLKEYMAGLKEPHWQEIMLIFTDQAIKRKSAFFIQNVEKASYLCVVENNTLIKELINEKQEQFFSTWSKMQDPLHA